MDSKRIAWLAVSAGTVFLARKVANRLLDSGWRMAAHDDPPVHAGGGARLLPALGWAVGSAAVISLAEFGAREAAASIWHRWTGEDPPED